MEALSLGTKSEQAEALRAITKDAARERRGKILEWWKAQLDDDMQDKEFLHYLQRSCV